MSSFGHDPAGGSQPVEGPACVARDHRIGMLQCNLQRTTGRWIAEIPEHDTGVSLESSRTGATEG